MNRICSVLGAVSGCALAYGCHHPHPTSAAVVKQNSTQLHRQPGEIVRSGRIRDAFTIRLGMVALRGLSDSGPEDEDSAANRTKLGPEMERWLAEHCDVLAVDASCITPETFPRMRKIQKLFTPLLFTCASTLYEPPGRYGNVGLWGPQMSAWELKNADGTPVRHPDSGGHWMDPGSKDWAKYYAEHAERLADKYRADGVVAAELGPANTFADLSGTKYKSFTQLVDATSAFLSIVHRPKQFQIVPSAVGFDNIVGRPTLPVERLRGEPSLGGRCWDEFDKLMDGVWAEGWVNQSWSSQNLPENFWEVQMEAADRAGRFSDNYISGDIFIAAIAYSSPEQLEYGLASYLLASHMQSRLVVQPMPIVPGQSKTAGLSAKVMKREFEKYRTFFDAPLGIALQERHEIVVNGNSVWRRRFQNGDVYVNSHDKGLVSVDLAAPMQTVTGKTIKMFDLGPHSGIILTNPLPPANNGPKNHSTDAK